MIDTLISIAGLGHQYISGIKKSKDTDRLFNNLSTLNNNIEKLTNRIYHVPVITPIITNDKLISDKRQIIQSIEPIAKALNTNILSTGLVNTPDMTKEQISKNAWKVLDSIRPVQFAEKHSNPDMVPILFENDGVKYVGWQMKNAIPGLFDWELNENNGLWDNKLKLNYKTTESADNILSIKELTWNKYPRRRAKVHTKPGQLIIDNQASRKGVVISKRIFIDEEHDYSIEANMELLNGKYSFGIFVGVPSSSFPKVLFVVSPNKYLIRRYHYSNWTGYKCIDEKTNAIPTLKSNAATLKIVKTWSTIEFYLNGELIHEGLYEKKVNYTNCQVGFIVNGKNKVVVNNFTITPFPIK